MKCAWVTGSCVTLTGVVVLALAPFLVPEPLHPGVEGDGSDARVFRGGDIVFTTAADTESRPDTLMTFTESKPRELGRLFVNSRGKLEFQGDAEASAQAFFNEVVDRWNRRTATASREGGTPISP